MLSEGGKRRRVTVRAALIKRLVQLGVSKGDMRAIDRLLAFAAQLDVERSIAAPVLDEDDRAVLEELAERLRRDER